MDFKSYEQVGRLYLSEYHLLMKAYALKRLDGEYIIHKQAWANQQATATKERGKKVLPYFDKFTDFFNYEELEKEIIQPVEEQKNIRNSRLSDLMVQANNL